MNPPQRVLLLIGSAKRGRSTSDVLGTALLERLREHGVEGETLFLHRSVHTVERRQELLAATERADMILLATPLYVDALPYLVVRALELIAEHRRKRAAAKSQSLVSILNCGFPEAHQNDTAIAICRQFAREAGLEWAGGLSLGGGEAIGGQPLESKGRMVRNVIRALEVSADALAAGERVPEEAVKLMAKPLVPPRMYTWLGAVGWRRQAKKHGATDKLDERPYEAAVERSDQS